MAPQGSDDSQPKLDVLHDAHDVLIHTVEAKSAGGSIIHQGASIHIDIHTQGGKGKGKQREIENPGTSPTLASKKDVSPEKPPVVDRRSPQWRQFMRGILAKCLSSLQDRNEDGPAVEPSSSCSKSKSRERSPELSLASFGGSKDSSALMARPSLSKGEAYVTSMLASGKGLACWQPRPQAPGQGVMPGDVGIFSVEEGFEKVFNIWDDEDLVRRTAAAGGYEVRYTVPTKTPNFIQTIYSEGDVVVRGTTSKTTYDPDGKTVTGFQFRHQESYQKGGVLALTSATVLEKLADSVKKSLSRHILQHAELLYRHAMALHDIPDDEGLYIVTGCIKSETWALAGFSDPMTPPENTLRLIRRQSDPSAGSPGIPRYVWTDRGTADGYSGASEVKGSQDQCLFIKGFKLDSSKSFREMVRETVSPDSGSSRSTQGGSGSSQSPPEGDRDTGEEQGPHEQSGSSQGSSLSGPGGDAGPNDGDFRLSMFPDGPGIESYHPCDVINAYILGQTGSEFAVSHDDDWIPTLKEVKNTQGTTAEQRVQHPYPHFISTFRNVSFLAPHEHVSEAKRVSHTTAVSPSARPPKPQAMFQNCWRLTPSPSAAYISVHPQGRFLSRMRFTTSPAKANASKTTKKKNKRATGQHFPERASEPTAPIQRNDAVASTRAFEGSRWTYAQCPTSGAFSYETHTQAPLPSCSTLQTARLVTPPLNPGRAGSALKDDLGYRASSEATLAASVAESLTVFGSPGPRCPSYPPNADKMVALADPLGLQKLASKWETIPEDIVDSKDWVVDQAMEVDPKGHIECSWATVGEQENPHGMWTIKLEGEATLSNDRAVDGAMETDSKDHGDLSHSATIREPEKFQSKWVKAEDAVELKSEIVEDSMEIDSKGGHSWGSVDEWVILQSSWTAQSEAIRNPTRATLVDMTMEDDAGSVLGDEGEHDESSILDDEGDNSDDDSYEYESDEDGSNGGDDETVPGLS